MEELFYLIAFVIIVGINLLARNKKLLTKVSNKDVSNKMEEILTTNKPVKNNQQIIKQKKKAYSPVTPQISTQIINEYPQESLNPSAGLENSSEKKFKFNPETMRDAIILKEILDIPVALR